MARSTHIAFSFTALLILAALTLSADRVEHWSFQRPVRPPVPSPSNLKHGDHVRNPIDAFVFQKLEQEGLPPAPHADKATLIRRASFDLIGLPPTPEEVAEFIDDPSPEAFPKLIDRLLASPHYGERWGRHWLDVARYADSGGYETDMYFRNAWRYRDYVVKSFNDDKPYDTFVQEQIAGDEIWPDNLDLDPKRVYVIPEEKRRHLEARIGTGLYALTPLIHESSLDAVRLKYETMTDWIDTTGSAFLGLTLGCARCHEHKFDPLTQRDYFALQATFVGSRVVEVSIASRHELFDFWQAYPHIIAVDEARRAYRLFERKFRGRKLTTEEKEEKRRLLEGIAQAVLTLPRSGPVSQDKWDGLMELPTVSVLGHHRPELVKPVYLLERGELSQPKERISPGLPSVLARATGRGDQLPGPFGSRKELALWLTRPDHPLTARVMANRIWHWHVGRGIVATPNDFGSHGQPPTHPALLDWLATESVAGGWSMKAMHRLIMLSSTYQMSSNYGTADHLARDPDNRYVWRMNRRRLEAEALWDSVHAVAGTLNLKMRGRPVVPPLAADELAALRRPWEWPVAADPAEHTRRGLYILVRRNFRFPMFESFDAPVTSASCPSRDSTTVAPQALWSLNNPSVFRQAQAFAGRVLAETSAQSASTGSLAEATDGDWVEHAWLVALARRPTSQEKAQALALLEKFVERAATGKAEALENPPAILVALPPQRATALVKLSLAIYNLNEFAFVD